MEKVFKNINVNLVAEHGALTKFKNGNWVESKLISKDLMWKNKIYTLLQKYTKSVTVLL